MKEIEDFYSESGYVDYLNINIQYFSSLYEKFKTSDSQDIILNDGENDSVIYPLSIISTEVFDMLPIISYFDLPPAELFILKQVQLCITKMQAGLGSSLERDDLILNYDAREKLGSKGTDLFIYFNNKYVSLAELQLIQAEKLAGKYRRVVVQNLVNEETDDAVSRILKKKTSFVKLKSFQLRMPTIGEDGKLSFKRIAPCGHGFLGFEILLNTFNDDIDDYIYSIGNGEDLNSTADDKILSWVKQNDIPLVMITTSKLAEDKKGGQISLAKVEKPYLCIVEKAQAEKANQLKYFEQLGLRDGDREGLFNTNIVLINVPVLKKIFKKCIGNMVKKDFISIITPDLIKNTKMQDGKEFIQLEGALGSVILNLDRYFRQKHNCELISFLNLPAKNRRDFFMPLKKREDFDHLLSDYKLNEETIRFERK